MAPKGLFSVERQKASGLGRTMRSRVSPARFAAAT
jgi:hypothetical protein